MSFCRRYILVTICTSWASELDFEDESEKVDRFFDLPLLVRVEDPSEYSVRDLFMWAPSATNKSWNDKSLLDIFFAIATRKDRQNKFTD